MVLLDEFQDTPRADAPALLIYGADEAAGIPAHPRDGGGTEAVDLRLQRRLTGQMFSFYVTSRPRTRPLFLSVAA